MADQRKAQKNVPLHSGNVSKSEPLTMHRCQLQLLDESLGPLPWPNMGNRFWLENDAIGD
jgi:hypothetical protein